MHITLKCIKQNTETVQYMSYFLKTGAVLLAENVYINKNKQIQLNTLYSYLYRDLLC